MRVFTQRKISALHSELAENFRERNDFNLLRNKAAFTITQLDKTIIFQMPIHNSLNVPLQWRNRVLLANGDIVNEVCWRGGASMNNHVLCHKFPPSFI